MNFRRDLYRLTNNILFLILLLTGFFSYSVKAQDHKFSNKLSPLLVQDITAKQYTRSLYRIMLTGKDLPVELNVTNFDPKKIIEYEKISFYMINATTDELLSIVLPLPQVLFVDDGNRTPKEEVIVSNLDLAANKINIVHRKFPQWNGEGLTVSIKENKPDTADIDFAGRYLSTSLSSSITSSHATNMATMIAGGGNSWYLGKGAAWVAILSSSDFANLLPDPLNVLKQYGISIQNHSYGVGVENFYGADAMLYDANANADTVLLNIFSSGNSGLSSSSSGRYSGIKSMANLTGSFKMAKNIITVGATDSFGNVAIQSSKGPAFDGRIKPELTAFGIDGTSGAAALVSGVALLLQQEYRQLRGRMPNSALTRAVLINSADDRRNAAVDFSNGFGSLNALNAVRTIQSGHYMNGAVSNGTVQSFNLVIPPGIKKIKITLVWNDPAAATNAATALINDLDLELVNVATSQAWKPWVLNSFPHIDSLKQVAARKRDSLNNIEQVTLDDPIAGSYRVSVKGYAVSSATQSFYMVYQLDSTDIYEWHFPAAQDPVFPNEVNTLRWQSSFAATTGKIDLSTDNGNTWQLIDPAADLSKGYYNWNAPATNSTALLRMTIGANIFISDTFVIAARTVTGVGFNCPDSFLYHWTKIPQANLYRLYKLGSRYLEPLLSTTDSFAVLQKNANPSFYYAVAPVINGKEGVKSYTLDYRLQGVGCYVRSFFATLVNNTVVLDLSLGSLYNINRIVLEKFDGTGFRPLQQIVNITGLSVSFIDTDLSPGLNIYRVKIELAGGGVVYTLEENVFYFGKSKYVVYPNPATQNREIYIAQAKVGKAIMQVFNLFGAKVFEKELDDRINTIPAGKLSKGVYFVHIETLGFLETIKMIVL